MIAASTVNSLGLDIGDTNISKSTAWRQSRQIRTETSQSIKNTFQPSQLLSVHWDGKLVNLKGNIRSNRVCVYVAGAQADSRP